MPSTTEPAGRGTRLLVDADGRLEREHGIGGRRRSLDSEEGVDAVEGAGEVGRDCEHVP